MSPFVLVYESITCGQCHNLTDPTKCNTCSKIATFHLLTESIDSDFISLDGYPLQAKKPISAKEKAKLLVGSGICRFLRPFILPILPPLDVAGSSSFRRLSKTSSLKYNSPKSQAQIKPWVNGLPVKRAIFLDTFGLLLLH